MFNISKYVSVFKMSALCGCRIYSRLTFVSCLLSPSVTLMHSLWLSNLQLPAFFFHYPVPSKWKVFPSFICLSGNLEIVFTLCDSTDRPFSQQNLQFSFILRIPIMPLVYLHCEICHTLYGMVPSEIGLCKAGKYYYSTLSCGSMSNALGRPASRWHRLFWELLTCHGKQRTLKQPSGWILKFACAYWATCERIWTQIKLGFRQMQIWWKDFWFLCRDSVRGRDGSSPRENQPLVESLITGVKMLQKEQWLLVRHEPRLTGLRLAISPLCRESGCYVNKMTCATKDLKALLRKLPWRDESDLHRTAPKHGCSPCRVEVPVRFTPASRSTERGRGQRQDAAAVNRTEGQGRCKAWTGRVSRRRPLPVPHSAQWHLEGSQVQMELPLVRVVGFRVRHPLWYTDRRRKYIFFTSVYF